MDETHKQSFKRETYLMTCAYIDLFFAKGNRILIGDYQTLALGAFIVATKINESMIPCIDLKVFTRS